jgi:hypothetical protein
MAAGNTDSGKDLLRDIAARVTRLLEAIADDENALAYSIAEDLERELGAELARPGSQRT